MDLRRYFTRKQTFARAKFIEHAIDVIAAPTDLLLSDPETLTGFDRDYFDELARAASLHLIGVEAADLDQCIERFNDPATRTVQALLLAQYASNELYSRSMWMNARRALEPRVIEATSNYCAPDQPGVVKAAVLLFFALHPELNPAGEDALPEGLTDELWTIYGRARSFFADNVGAHGRWFIIHELGEKLPHSRRAVAKTSTKPLDLLSHRLYSGTAPEEGKLRVSDMVKTSKRGRKDGAAVAYVLDFAELRKQGVNVPLELTPFDERVLMAADALQVEKGKDSFFSLFELHRTMGFNGTPSDTQRKRIDDSVMKQAFTLIDITNAAEVEAGYDYQPFNYRSYLLPVECMDSFIDGRYTDTTYHLLRRPPIIAFAKQRGQYTTLPIELFQTPGRKTDEDIALENYLLTRIAQAKNALHRLQEKRVKSDSVKQAIMRAKREPILLATVYENVQPKGEADRNRMQRTRARDRLEPILDHYTACKWIAGYELEEKRVTVKLE